MIRSTIVGCVLACSLAAEALAGGYPVPTGYKSYRPGSRPSQSKGWVQDSTRITTPKPIQSLDPSRVWPRPDEGGYTGMWDIESRGGNPQPPFIDANGNVWSGSGVHGQQGQLVGRAQLSYNAHGQAFWSSSFRNQWGSASAVRAPGHDRQWGGGAGASDAQRLLEWDALNHQGATRPTLMSTMPRRGN